jgi:hypothetical protein
MKNKLKIIIIFLALIVVGFLFYANLMTFGNQREPKQELSIELKKFERILVEETKGGSYTYIDLISNYKLKNCQNDKISQRVVLNICNKNIETKEKIQSYANTVDSRLEKILPYKQCIDSIIIEAYSIKYDRVYRFSYPIK